MPLRVRGAVGSGCSYGLLICLVSSRKCSPPPENGRDFPNPPRRAPPGRGSRKPIGRFCAAGRVELGGGGWGGSFFLVLVSLFGIYLALNYSDCIDFVSLFLVSYILVEGFQGGGSRLGTLQC